MHESIKTEILNTIASDKAEMLEFTKELVSIATENPPGTHYRACVEAIEKKLAEAALDYEILEVPHPDGEYSRNDYPRWCILASHGKGERTLYFHGHYDVVPGSNEEQFHPQLKGDHLYGRGSADMKSGLAAMIYAIKALKDMKIDLGGKIGLAIVPDEETGGLLGSNYLAEKGLLGRNGIGALLPEPTSGVIWNANRGAITFRISVKGKPAHVGLQYQGSNAFEKMIPIANALLDLKNRVEKRTTNYSVHPDPARQSILLIGGKSGGGSNFNLVPERFSFTIDRRINPEENLEEEKQSILSLLEGFRKEGIDLEIENLQEGRSSGISEENAVAQILAKNIKSITGKQPGFEMCPGLLETRFYASKGIPAFAYGPGLLSVAHGPKEFVNMEEVCNCSAIYAMTAIDLLG